MSASRLEKYENEYSNMSRTKKNQPIYNSTDIGELSRIKTNTNVSVISDAQKEIDINKIKNYLKALNNEENESKRRVSLELPEEEPEVVERKEEKDYDINSVLERARVNREVDYEENRHRKINNSQTQIDILKNIKIREQEMAEGDPDVTGPIDELNTEEKTIVELIQDIQKHGGSKKDLFEDLMSDDDTETKVMGMADKEKELRDTLLSITQDLESVKIPDNEFTQEIEIVKEKIKNSNDEEEPEVQEDKDNESAEDTAEVSDASIDLSELEGTIESTMDTTLDTTMTSTTEMDLDDATTDTVPKITTIDKSFYTNSMTFNKSDFEGFEDLEKSSSGAFPKVAIAIIVVMLLITVFLILNFVLDWNII